jgi:parvulin-like peptidyl-prolyl isomerase
VRNLVAAAALAVLGGPVCAQPNKPVATVNGEPITFAEVDNILKHQPPQATPLTEAQRRENQKAVVDMLVDILVMKQFLRKQFAGKPGFEMNAPQVNAQLAELAGALKQKENKTLAEFLQQTGQTEAELRAEIVMKLQWKAFVDQHISEADVRKYYEDNKPFFDKVVVRASHILIRVPATAKDAERQTVRNKLLAIRNEIVSGKIDFAEAAKKYSECPSKAEGGNIGSFPRKGVVVESFARAAFALKPGEVSGVAETDYGMHLIKVVERSPGEPSNFDKIKDDVRSFCAREMYDSILTREHNAARIQLMTP